MLLTILLSVFFTQVAHSSVFSSDYLSKLKNTYLTNMDEVISKIGMHKNETETTRRVVRAKRSHRDFTLANPYWPRFTEDFDQPRYEIPENELSYTTGHRFPRIKTISYFAPEFIVAWMEKVRNHTDEEVCAVKFTNESQTRYQLKTFANEMLALAQGYTVTHHNHCGACSSLQDLAVYLKHPDLTTVGRACGKRRSFPQKLRCFEEFGMTNTCAQAWAYNTAHSKLRCAVECIREYGLMSLLRGDFSPTNNPDGSLDGCLACDEEKSGPGFKYLAGRVRRNSGIISSIQRQSTEIRNVNHLQYFY